MSQHNAPSVAYPLGRSRLQVLAWSVLWLAGLLLVGLWAQTSQNIDWRQVVGLTALSFAGMAGYQAIKHSPAGRLAWDGQNWHWESPGYPSGMAEYDVVVAADFQHLMLLRVGNSAGASIWLWAEQGAQPERWMDFRRAVYSPHRESNVSVSPS